MNAYLSALRISVTISTTFSLASSLFCKVDTGHSFIGTPWLVATMQIWWFLPSLFLIVVSSCTTGFYSGKPPDCYNKERGANSFLWTIRRHPPAYLFGTIHVPYTRVWDWIPENSKTAFINSDSAIFELDLTNTDTMTALADCQILPKGNRLSDLLPGEMYLRLESYLDYVKTNMRLWMRMKQKRRGLLTDYMFNTITGNWRRKRPVWVLLMVNSLNEVDVSSRGVPVLDLYLAQLSKNGGKVTGAVERVEDQCGPLNQLNVSQVIFALNQTLSQHELLREQGKPPSCSSEALIKHYNCGDLNSFIFDRDTTQVPVLVNSSFSWQESEETQQIEQYFQDQLVDRRNARMADKVVALLQQHPGTSFFFAFGAGHFLGKDNVIDRLRRAGFRVDHTSPCEHIRRKNKPIPEYPRKSRRVNLSDEFPQSSDFLYEDIRYLFSKRACQLKRHRKTTLKLLRTQRRQKHMNILLERWDPAVLNLAKWGNIKSRTDSVEDNIIHDLWMHTLPVSFDDHDQHGKLQSKHGVFRDRTQRQNNPSSNVSPLTKPNLSNSLSAVIILSICVTLRLQ